ncbi:leucine-rich repeat protein soc-2 homolog [Rhopalosiphum maidis]|uniref:leucine-rich repeat protein soc-2 homolog n=1 Tax=Rhopalosiphum maidis TaxID=43146 RepID=UPI000F00B757|nr:leucine-rich repeat protein soc-2 homolog [Rhopalosiphum maidis]
MLRFVYHANIGNGKLELEFKKPNKLLLIESLDINCLDDIIRIMADERKIMVNELRERIINRFDPTAVQCIALDSFDKRILNMTHLTSLRLENCDLPTIPVEIGRLPIEVLSIRGSKLPTNQDTFWNWISMTSICNTLKSLNLDSTGLKRLPFEIMFLKNLYSLSARYNELTYIPHCLLELEKVYFNLEHNALVYVPQNLFFGKNLGWNLLDNPMVITKCQKKSYIRRYLDVLNKENNEDYSKITVQPLTNLSLYNFMDNFNIPFKRQDIPRTLWVYLNLVGRCIVCNRWILPDYSKIKYTHSKDEIPFSEFSIGYLMQSMSCSIPNNCKIPSEN